MKKNKILYLSYDGLLEPLGESQILSYQYKIANKYNVTIVSFEKSKDLKNINKLILLKNNLKEKNIVWNYLVFSNNLKYISTIYNFLKGFILIIRILLTNKISIIHCRGYVTYMMIYFLKYIFKFKILFDMRGFWVDERIEWNIWKKNTLKYNIFKYIELKLINNANCIVTLTSDAKIQINKILNKKIKNIYFDTIHTCVDFQNYQIDNKKLFHSKSDKIIFCHLGAISTRYDFDRVLWFINEINKYKKCELLIINQKEHQFIEKKIHNSKIDKSLIQIISLDFKDIPKYLANIDFGIFFPKEGFYLNGFFPTKFAEFVASSKPIITYNINKDFDNLLINYDVGIIIKRNQQNISNNDFDKIISYKNSIKLKDRTKTLINDHLSSKVGVSKYLNLYDKLIRDA